MDSEPGTLLALNNNRRLKLMKRRQNRQSITAKFLECLRDDRGAVMVEYLLITAIMVPLICYLFHPDNGFYKGQRDQYELTTLALELPGP
jgi:hypothetical protein